MNLDLAPDDTLPETAPERLLSRIDRAAVFLMLLGDEEASAILGRLDDFTTRSGYTISPVVLWGGAGLRPVANPLEVDSIHRIPVSEFLREDAPMLRPGPEADRPILRMPVGNTWIAAPTAALLLQFREVCLLGRDTRVSHFDQPKFAWR